MVSRRNSLKAVSMTGALIGLNAISPMVMAMTAPANDKGFGYFFYDIIVNQILHGPIGFAVGVCVIVFSASYLSKNWMGALAGIIGGSAIIKADAIVVSMGALLC